ncbi:MAG: radical SAM protein [Endomicrobiales bacterium]|nr:radical SAM protein [Endomicrobiales bacterium]
MDLIKKNREINAEEIRGRRTTLDSTPQYVTIGSHYKCNSKCVFCMGGDYPEFTLNYYTEYLEKRLENVVKKAEFVGFCGFGETLLMPEAPRFLDHINGALEDNIKVFTTNGIRLGDAICDRLAEGRYSVLISLHASRKELHKSLTGTDSFDSVLRNVKKLVDIRNKKRNDLHVNLVFLATSMNIDDLPDFVKLAHLLGVDRVTCNYLTVFVPEHLKMSTYFHKDAALRSMGAAEELADRYGIELVLPPKYGQKRDGAKQMCHDPWNFFYVEVQGSVNPCCFAGNHIGNIKDTDFKDIWNGPGYKVLREGHISGKVHNWCRYCYKYDSSNVDDIRSHITFRPETQRQIMKYLYENRNEYKVPEEALKL